MTATMPLPLRTPDPAAARLAFELPDFMRSPAWVSAAARDRWEPRLTAAARAWSSIERESAGRTRNAALVFAGPAELPELRTWCDARQLMLLPLAAEGVSSQAYAASSTSMVAGGAWRMRCVVCVPSIALEVHQAFGDRDEVALGAVLGYPTCCSAFFARVWGEERWRDTTWPMAANTAMVAREIVRVDAAAKPGERHPDACRDRARILVERCAVDASMPLECNILLRWLGIRLVPHLPCSFVCAATAAMGRALADLGRELGHADAIDTIYELLSWPIEWSALHGIAEVKTPAFKFAAKSDASAHKWIVRRHGRSYPEHGATGIQFPYRPSVKRAGAETKAFAAAIAHDASSIENGFATAAAEAEAHAVVLRAAAALEDASGTVLDLGCGNGRLVAEICRARVDRTGCGVELQLDRAARAAAALGKENVTAGAIAGAWPRSAPYGIIVVMPGRLLEVDADTKRAIAARILESTDRVIVYAYGDWLQRDSAGLPGLVRSAFGDCLELGTIERSAGVEAAAATVSR